MDIERPVVDQSEALDDRRWYQIERYTPWWATRLLLWLVVVRALVHLTELER